MRLTDQGIGFSQAGMAFGLERPILTLSSVFLRCGGPVVERKVWTEPACEDWLCSRAVRGPWRCPHCGPATANWLASRKVLQCTRCRRQTGLRSGTVMAGSPLALAAWFRAIEAVVADPPITAAELGRLVGLARPATAQRVLAKIRDALASDDRELLLAGLPQDRQSDHHAV